jgi:hypothetical protein
MDKNTLKEISSLIIELLIRKNELYNDSMFKFGELGLFMRIYDKTSRLKNILWDNPDKFTKGEKDKIILNSVIDILGYSLAWLCEFIDVESLREFVEKDKY